MRNNREYQICKDIAIYMRYQYPNVIFHFDLAGLNLSKAQAGMMKAIQGGRGWPDLFIAEPTQLLEGSGDESSFNCYSGLFIELKTEGTKLRKKDMTCATPHIQEQWSCIIDLEKKGYMSRFAVGFDMAKEIIDNYLK